jgi:hypothetical protein
MSAAFMTLLVCDDVRREEGNKVSYMGVYGPNLQLREFPATLPKLCFVMAVHQPATEPLRDFHIRLYQDDKVIADTLVEAAAVDPVTSIFPGDGEKKRIITAVIQAAPFHFSEPCKLKARAEWTDGDLVLKGGTLSVEKPE